MDKALRYMFWGYIFIFFRIQIGFDWLADPVGYYLIYSGCSMLTDTYPHAKKGRIAAGVGMIFTIPAVFVDLSASNLGDWEIYSSALLVLKLIVAFYLFAVLKSIVKDYGNQALIIRTNNVYTFYTTIHLSVLMLLSFSLNVSEAYWGEIIVLLPIGVVIMDITFLFLLAAIRREKPPRATFDYLA